MQRGTQLYAGVALFALLVTASLVKAETRKEFRFSVGPRPSLSIINQYGPISAKPSTGNEIVVVAVLKSDKVEIDQSKNGNRIDLVSHLLPGANIDNARVEYQVTAPAGTSLTLHTTTGDIQVEKVHGDLALEGASANVDVRDVANCHVHVNTLNGPITLTNVSDGHIELTSVSGNITLRKVDGPLVRVNSSSGSIRYDGDFAFGGEYSLTSHTGDIEATAPSYASIDVTARSVKGQVDNEFPLQPKTHSAFSMDTVRNLVGTAGKAASSVKLLSFSGKIHLKKR
ncbi:MAG TPA: DUF4097 family beta strand repeat-containing protein [Terriglobales bacterium]|jgi:DUF4097 and DUF4098 domain-containing protein YvlB